MKRLLISTFAIATLAAVPALAQSGDHHRNDTTHTQSHQGQHGDHGGNTGGDHGGSAGGDHGGGTDHHGNDHGGSTLGGWGAIHNAVGDHGNRGDDHSGAHRNRGDDHRDRGGDHGGTVFHPIIAPTYHGIEPRHNRPPNWNVQPRHFDRHVYRRVFSAPHRFHWRTYHRPRGWYVHRWAFGEILPRFFWVQDYWITDWWMFDLPVPPYGYRWVRYGDDALLVNIYTGEILQVVYDLFD